MASRYWKGVAHLVRALFDKQKQEWDEWERKENGKSFDELSPAIQTRQVILGRICRWVPLNDAKLETLFSSETTIDFSREKLILPLPPFPSQQREFIPVMSMFYDPAYDPAKECIEMRVGMYCLNAEGEPCGFAFRLEAPTSICKGQSTQSIHDFYHVQFMQNLVDYAPPLNLPDWLPEYQPSICVRAENPVEAILNLVLSLYGLGYFAQFMKQVKSNIRDSDMRLLRDLLR